MKPTARLRFVEREVRIPIREGIARCEHHKFLQQWWAFDPDSYTDWITKTNGEWRDVPLEKEE